MTAKFEKYPSFVAFPDNSEALNNIWMSKSPNKFELEQEPLHGIVTFLKDFGLNFFHGASSSKVAKKGKR